MSESLRHQLVDDLKRRKVIVSKRIERAFRAVPRHLFVPHVDAQTAYDDNVVVVKTDADGRAISSSSQPTMMAIMLQQLGLRPGMNVLEIGAGSGYNAALMAHIVGEKGRVTTLDIDDDLVEGVREHLESAGYAERVQAIRTDGVYGYPPNAPYDRIILTVAVEDVSPAWIEQLGAKGRIVLPLWLRSSQIVAVLEREGDHLVSRDLKGGMFMSLRGDHPAGDGMIDLDIAPGIHARLEKRVTDDPQVVARLLNDYRGDQNTQLHGKVNDVLASLMLWESDADLPICFLRAQGESIQQGIVPYLYGSQEREMCATVGVIEADGLVLLSRAPDTPFPESAIDPRRRFPLYLRIYGNGGADLARRYLVHLHAWHKAKRPGLKRLKLALYPKDATPPHTNAVVIPKTWHNLLLRWQ